MSTIRISISDADPKYDPSEALLRGCEVEKAPEECCIVVHCWRARDKWDCDNVSVKPILDGFVRAGILQDDSQKQVKGFVILPYRCKSQDQEKTIVEIKDANELLHMKLHAEDIECNEPD